MSDFYTEIISNQLIKRLHELNMTAEELSKRTNITKSKISRIVNKKGIFSIGELHIVAEKLHVPVDYFMSYNFNESNNSLVIPVVDITEKSKSTKQVCQIKLDDYSDKALIGLYVNKSISSSLIPNSTILIINMEKSDTNVKPLVYLKDVELCFGILQDDKYIMNIYDSTLVPINSISILGSVDKQFFFDKSKVHADKTILSKYAEHIKNIPKKYDYLYKLLSLP